MARAPQRGAILRTVIGGALYFGLSSLLKPILGLFFPADSFGGLLMRSARYGLVLFVLIAIYPYAFRLKKKLFRK